MPDEQGRMTETEFHAEVRRHDEEKLPEERAKHMAKVLEERAEEALAIAWLQAQPEELRAQARAEVAARLVIESERVKAKRMAIVAARRPLPSTATEKEREHFGKLEAAGGTLFRERERKALLAREVAVDYWMARSLGRAPLPASEPAHEDGWMDGRE